MLKNTFYPTVFMTVALLLFALLVVPQAFAVTFTVNSTEDQPDDLTMIGTCHTAVNTCTLRAAVMQANRAVEGATIMLPSGIYKLTIPAAGADGEENGDLNLTTPAIGTPFITISGAGASTTIIDGGKLDNVFHRVLHVHPNRLAAISGVTIRNGYAAGAGTNPYGGGIFNEGLLTVSNAAVSGNYSNVLGGGILNWGTLTVINSTISQNMGYYSGGGIQNWGIYSTLTVINSTISQNNTVTDGAAGLGADGHGGGILNYDGNLFVTSSTISNNSSNYGGGIEQSGGSVKIVNSTISGNKAMTDGGGIYDFDGTTDVYNSTITQNSADYDRDPNGGSGGGVYVDAQLAQFGIYGTVNLRNTLVAGNDVANAPIPDDCKGTINSYGVNLFSDFTGCTVINDVLAYSGYFTGGLGPLQNNGGPTWTHALLPGSNAIDGGDQVKGCIGPDGLLLVKDQRGAERAAGIFQLCDIGAFEYGAILPRLYLPLILRN